MLKGEHPEEADQAHRGQTKKGKRKGEQEKQVHRGVSTRCRPPGLWIVRPRLPTYVSSFQPTVIFLDEAGNRHVTRQGADEKGRPEGWWP